MNDDPQVCHQLQVLVNCDVVLRERERERKVQGGGSQDRISQTHDKYPKDGATDNTAAYLNHGSWPAVNTGKY